MNASAWEISYSIEEKYVASVLFEYNELYV